MVWGIRIITVHPWRLLLVLCIIRINIILIYIVYYVFSYPGEFRPNGTRTHDAPRRNSAIVVPIAGVTGSSAPRRWVQGALRRPPSVLPAACHPRASPPVRPVCWLQFFTSFMVLNIFMVPLSVLPLMSLSAVRPVALFAAPLAVSADPPVFLRPSSKPPHHS